MAWMLIVEWSARLILLLMIGLSVWSISIILNRRNFFSRWKKLKSNKEIEDKDFEYKESDGDPRLEFLSQCDGLPEKSLDQVYTAFKNDCLKDWGQGLNVLGTLGSTTPFIGLLGTILGIIVSFGELSENSADMNAVMFSLAEALILTAVGLAVAIPAVIAFNYFNKKMNTMLRDVESIKERYKARKQIG